MRSMNPKNIFRPALAYKTFVVTSRLPPPPPPLPVTPPLLCFIRTRFLYIILSFTPFEQRSPLFPTNFDISFSRSPLFLLLLLCFSSVFFSVFLQIHYLSLGLQPASPRPFLSSL
uniref:Transmembrane protein n=1 Tax=Cacopsylla melanoneura TaxID=428564 RepID=A0A8D8T3L6_9HEMI